MYGNFLRRGADRRRRLRLRVRAAERGKYRVLAGERQAERGGGRANQRHTA